MARLFLLSIAAACVALASAQVEVSWRIPYEDDEEVRAAVGSTVVFNFEGGIPHNVVAVPNQEAFDACTKSPGVTICAQTSEASSCTVNVTEGTQYLICTVGDHCAEEGQKIIVVGESVAATEGPSSPANTSVPTPGGAATPVPTPGNGTSSPTNGTATPTSAGTTVVPTAEMTSAPTSLGDLGTVGALVGSSPCLSGATFTTEKEAMAAAEFCNCTGIHGSALNGFKIGLTDEQCKTEFIDVNPAGEIRLMFLGDIAAGLAGIVTGLQPDCMDGVLTINQGFSCFQVLGFDSPGETIYQTGYTTDAEGQAFVNEVLTMEDLGFTPPKNIRYLVGLTVSMFGCGVEFPETEAPTASPSAAPTMNATAAPSSSPTFNVTGAPSASPTPNATMPPSATLPPSTDINTTAPTGAPVVGGNTSAPSGTITVAPVPMPDNTTGPTTSPTPNSTDSETDTTLRVLQTNGTAAPSAMGNMSDNTTTMAPTPMGTMMPTMSNDTGPFFFPRIACARFLPDEESQQTFGDVVPENVNGAVVTTPFAMLQERDDSSINGSAFVDFQTLSNSLFTYTLKFTPPITVPPSAAPTNATATPAPSPGIPIGNTSAPTPGLTVMPTNSSDNSTDNDERRVLQEVVTGFVSVREGTCENVGDFFEAGDGVGGNSTFWEEFSFELSASNTEASDTQSLFQFSQAVLNQSDYEGLPVVANDPTGETIFACGILQTPALPRGIIYVYPQLVGGGLRRLAEGNASNDTGTFNIIGQFLGLPEGSTVTVAGEEVQLETGDDGQQFFAPQTTEATLAELQMESYMITDSEGNVISQGTLSAEVVTPAPTPVTESPTPEGGTVAPTTAAPTTAAQAQDNALALGLGLGLGLGIPLVLAIGLFTWKSMEGDGGGAKEPAGKDAYQGQEQTAAETAGTAGQSSFGEGVQRA